MADFHVQAQIGSAAVHKRVAAFAELELACAARAYEALACAAAGRRVPVAELDKALGAVAEARPRDFAGQLGLEHKPVPVELEAHRLVVERVVAVETAGSGVKGQRGVGKRALEQRVFELGLEGRGLEGRALAALAFAVLPLAARRLAALEQALEQAQGRLQAQARVAAEPLGHLALWLAPFVRETHWG